MLQHEPAVSPSDFGSGRWRGRWTWLVDGHAEASDGFFRRTLEVDHVPDRVPARLTADTRYRLWVNGVEVLSGPIRSQPRRWRYDLIDLAPFLQPGRNVLALQVKHLPGGGAYWMESSRNDGLGGHGVFCFEADLGPAGWLISDDQWLGLGSSAWQGSEIGGGLPIEVLDARLLPLGWTGVDFDDHDWPATVTLGPRHIGAYGDQRPPSDPYGPLLPNPLPPPLPRIRRPTGQTVARVVGELEHTQTSPVRRLEQAVGWPTTSADGDVASATSYELIRIDFGAVVCGRVGLRVNAPAGTTLEISFTEDPLVDAEANLFFPQVGARYTCRGGGEEFETFVVYGLRFVNVLVPTIPDATVERCWVSEILHPYRDQTSFDSSDPQLNAIFAASVRTVALCSHDAFVDCATREQRAWVGDGVVHQLAHLVTSDDWSLARHHLELTASPRSDGILPMNVAGDVEQHGGLTIPDWSLHWVHGLWCGYRWSGDAALLRSLLPVAQRVLAWFEPFVDDHGLLADVTEWTLVDWSSVTTTGTNAVLTGLWARGLREYAELARAVGDQGAASWADQRHAAARAGFELFWDEVRGSYVDHAVDGIPQPQMHQLAGALAIVGDLAPEDRWDRISATITDPSRVVRRSWSVGSDDAYAKLQRQLDGERVIDWDVHTEIVRAQPFTSYLVHDAVARAGRADRLPEILRDWSEFLQPTADGLVYDTIGECWGWGTHAHAWSCTPVKDLIIHVLGVSPAEPGFSRVRVAPRLGDLDRLSARVPTPHGPVTVRATATAVEIDSPVPIDFSRPGQPVEQLPAGQHRRALA